MGIRGGGGARLWSRWVGLTTVMIMIPPSAGVPSTPGVEEAGRRNCSGRGGGGGGGGAGHGLVSQVYAALGRPRTKEEVAARLIDDHFDYLRDSADVSFGETAVRGVLDLAAHVDRLPAVPVLDVRSSSFNTSALCAVLQRLVPRLRDAANVQAFVILTLGSAAHGSPFHPAILRDLRRSCAADAETKLEALVHEPKLRRWFLSQHFPVVVDPAAWSDHPNPKHQADVGDITPFARWVLHPKLHHVPIGLPRIFSKHLEREDAWLKAFHRTQEPCGERNNGLPRSDADDSIYVNFKPRRYREAITAVLRRRFEAALPNRYVGKERVRTRAERDTVDYVDALFAHRFVLSPPGSGIDCYRHWETLVAGAIPLVEYNPLAVELLAGLPAVVVRSWDELSPAFLRDAHARLASGGPFAYERLTTDYWRNELKRAKAASIYLPLLDHHRNPSRP